MSQEQCKALERGASQDEDQGLVGNHEFQGNMRGPGNRPWLREKELSESLKGG